jgi:hypothetical protein
MPNASPFKAAPLGCGKIGWRFQDDPGALRFGICIHAAVLSTLEDVQLIAVANPDTQKARCFCGALAGAVAYHEVRKLLDASPPDIMGVQPYARLTSLSPTVS